MVRRLRARTCLPGILVLALAAVASPSSAQGVLDKLKGLGSVGGALLSRPSFSDADEEKMARANAAKFEAENKLWQEAEKEFAEGERSDEKEAKAAKHRGQAKDYAREWLDYAKASEQDTKTAMALCVSAAGNRAFCEGG